jgi:PAS domain S-box-containing protein
MTETDDATPPSTATHSDKAMALALRLAHAENSLLMLTSGQVDAIIDPDGRPYLLRPAQEHLRQNERRLKAVIDSAADVIMVVNRGGVILSQNHASVRVLGYEPEELLANNVFEYIHTFDYVVVYSAFFNVAEGLRESATFQLRFRSRDGFYRVINATVAKLNDDSAPSVVFCLRPTDYPLSQPAEKPQRQPDGPQALLAKDRFLATLAHELRAPLAPALMGIEELQQDERFSEAAPTLAMIRRNIEFQSRLLAELFDFTSLGQRKIHLRSQLIDAHAAIHLVLEVCQPEIAAAQIQVLLDFRPSEAFVLADPVKLQQVMWNLLKNAIRFSPPASDVSISTFDGPSDRLNIEFADHGIGIKPDLLPLIFDSFQQGELSNYEGTAGLGLGLFIAKGLAEAQGGKITAFSGGHGKGATFCLTLPKAPSSGPASSKIDLPAEY